MSLVSDATRFSRFCACVEMLSGWARCVSVFTSLLVGLSLFIEPPLLIGPSLFVYPSLFISRLLCIGHPLRIGASLGIGSSLFLCSAFIGVAAGISGSPRRACRSLRSSWSRRLARGASGDKKHQRERSHN